MDNLVMLVSDRLGRLPKKVLESADFGADGEIAADLRAALLEAERLSDLFSDIKPEPYSISENHLFSTPKLVIHTDKNA